MRRFLDITSAPFSSRKSSRELSPSADIKPETAPGEALLRFWRIQPGDVQEAANALGWVANDGRLIASAFDLLDYECGKCFFPLWGLNVMPRDRTAEFKHREEKFSVNVLSYRISAKSGWFATSMPAGYRRRSFEGPHSGSDSDSTISSTDSSDSSRPKRAWVSRGRRSSESGSSSDSSDVHFSATHFGVTSRKKGKKPVHGGSALSDALYGFRKATWKRRRKGRSGAWSPEPLWLKRARLPADGCPGCNLMRILMKFTKDVVIQSGNNVANLSFPWKEQKLRVYIEGHKRGKILPESALSLGLGPYNAGLDVFVDQAAESVGNLGRATQISGNTASSSAMQQAQTWFSTCQTKHSLCGEEEAARDDFNPRRLIAVECGDTSIVRLVEFKVGDSAVPYACLSHCWGTYRALCLTTKDTLEANFERIPTQSMPKTFQDAVDITRRLGLSYLWIDSMCIIQEDDEDWSEQSSLMAKIFRRAQITLAAGWAVDDQGGMYARASQAYIGQRHKWSSATDAHINTRVHMWHPYEPYTTKACPMPLLTRAWVWQERILSSRILYFGAQELLWECRECKKCECDSWVPDETAVFTQDTLAKLAHEKIVVIHESWRSVVESYSALNLTFVKDKLPALSGVAKVFREYLQDDYLAGMWRSRLSADIAWRTREFPTKWRPNAATPSWSWASIDSSVYWLDWTRSYFEVLDAHTTPATDDDTGEVLQGSLTIRGINWPIRLQESRFAERTANDQPDFDFLSMSIAGDPSFALSESVLFQPDFKFWHDQADFMRQLRDECWCFMIGSNTEYTSWPALLLRRAEHGSGEGLPIFNRVGLIHINNPTWDGASYRILSRPRETFVLA